MRTFIDSHFGTLTKSAASGSDPVKLLGRQFSRAVVNLTLNAKRQNQQKRQKRQRMTEVKTRV